MSEKAAEVVSGWQAIVPIAKEIAWPIAAIIIAILLLPLVTKLLRGGRISRLSLGPVTIDLAMAREYRPASPLMFLADQPPGYDISSFLPVLMQQFEGREPIDYVAVDLKDGCAWLCSRLYIFAILLQRMRGLRAIVFLHEDAGTTRSFLGIADVGRLRFALARHYPHLEQAYAMAYGGWTEGKPPGLELKEADKATRPDPRVLSNSGALSTQAASQLVRNFMAIIRRDHDPRTKEEDQRFVPWLCLPRRATEAERPPQWEAAEWLDAIAIERLLGDDLSHAFVERSSAKEQTAALVRHSGEFVALVDQRGRFEGLIDRRRVADVQAISCLE